MRDEHRRPPCGHPTAGLVSASMRGLILPSAPARIRPLSAVSPLFSPYSKSSTPDRVSAPGGRYTESKSRRAAPHQVIRLAPPYAVAYPSTGRSPRPPAPAIRPKHIARRGTAAGEDAIPLGLSIPQHAGPRSRDRSSPWGGATAPPKSGDPGRKLAHFLAHKVLRRAKIPSEPAT